MREPGPGPWSRWYAALELWRKCGLSGIVLGQLASCGMADWCWLGRDVRKWRIELPFEPTRECADELVKASKAMRQLKPHFDDIQVTINGQTVDAKMIYVGKL